ncbi:MAG: ubiquinol-cytochrome c reductase iron-sulfur subunit [Solirubrobacterales bacterium]|nr:ubiquinol-cytochrome c reductase iron-sulfur subunit [Solirubrobacterales bacterium]
MSDGPHRRPTRLRGTISMIAALLTARALRDAFARRRQARVTSRPLRTGEDPSQRDVAANRRAETLVAILLVGAGLFAFAFTIVYAAAGASTQLLAVTLGGALALLAAGAIVAGKALVPQEKSVEQRDVLLKEDELHEVLEIIESGGEGISRRKLLAGAAGLAGAGVLTAAVTPLASLGPDLDAIHQTPWRRGVRLVDDQGRPYTAEEVQIGSFYTALPEHADPGAFGSGLLLVKLPADRIHLPPARRDWAPEGILAYSKICPHAGCAISLYRYPTYQPTSVGPAFTCPCHYSTFSPGEGGRLMFGPAGRALPQLPLMIDAERNVRAAAPFREDIGPSWWSVRRGQS